MTKTDQNKINHIVIALDASGSMQPLESTVVKVTDGLVADLATQSKQMDQETRLTIYKFDSRVECLIWDMDVLRVPSIANLYRVNPHGMTALIDATLTAINELKQVTQIHGDHSFLSYIVTDGGENVSRNRAAALSLAINQLDENWTMGALVPNFQGVAAAKSFGFPPGNVMTWDATSARGVEEAGIAVAASTQSFMTTRATTGARSTTNLFGAANAVSKAAVAASGIKPLDPRSYDLVHVPQIPEKTWIMNYVRDTLGLPYRLGNCFYELTKREKIARDKEIAILEKRGTQKNIYLGFEARQLLGLPDADVRVAPGHNPDYTVFVQSKSTNRHLVPQTTLLIRK
jgi:hypothetical protein